MFVTDDESLAQRARYLTTQAKDDPLEFVHGAIGYNYRLTSIQAAMGCAQMEVLDEYVAAKRRIAARYDAAFAGMKGITPMREAPWSGSIRWMYTVLVDDTAFGMDSRTLLRALASQGIQSRPLWQPMHQSPAHQDAQARSCPVTETLHRQALSLPCSVGLRPEDQDRVIAAIGSLHA